jgi:hypothetical protein
VESEIVKELNKSSTVNGGYSNIWRANNMLKIIVALGIFVSILTVIPVYAQSTLALQEKCTEGAKTFVQRLDSFTSYESHYNKKLDKCFIRVGFYFGQIKEDVKLGNGKTTSLKHPHWMVALYNVFDGKMIGNCAYIGMEKQECWVDNSKCKTNDEFENLIHPYMEE